jgi:hypothetical protein
VVDDATCLALHLRIWSRTALVQMATLNPAKVDRMMAITACIRTWRRELKVMVRRAIYYSLLLQRVDLTYL